MGGTVGPVHTFSDLNVDLYVRRRTDGTRCVDMAGQHHFGVPHVARPRENVETLRLLREVLLLDIVALEVQTASEPVANSLLVARDGFDLGEALVEGDQVAGER